MKRGQPLHTMTIYSIVDKVVVGGSVVKALGYMWSERPKVSIIEGSHSID